ncbi:hypothetical protein HanIR_Chr17g0868341 [Helianthus annuus]|nr:hypothetical protein HanIR_Chr17g0868341 [Helianthus annuus]
MAYKTYKGEKYQYKEWTISELESETARIQDMIKNKVKQTHPIWAKFKKNVPDRTLQLKRMKEELITANFGSKNQVARWKEDKVFASYKKLEELRKKNRNLPQKPVYPEAVVPAKQQKLQIRRSTAPPAAILYQTRKQKQMDAETKADKAAGDYVVKIGLKQMIGEKLELTQTTNTAKRVITRPPSPNSPSIKPLPRNPLESKILKWISNKQTRVLTLIKTSGEVKKISRKQALGLGVEDLHDLLDLTLCRDEDDTNSLDFELQFKGQVRELLMRQ